MPQINVLTRPSAKISEWWPIKHKLWKYSRKLERKSLKKMRKSLEKIHGKKWTHVKTCREKLWSSLYLQTSMLMFSRNFHHGSKSRDGTPFSETSPFKHNGAAEQDAPTNSFFNRANDKRDGRASMKKSRPHSWHSTLQRGLARARSRSSGREKEKDRVKRASSALNAGKSSSSKVSEQNVGNFWKEVKFMIPIWVTIRFTEITICQLNLSSLEGNRFWEWSIGFRDFIFKECIACLAQCSNFSIDKHGFWQFWNGVEFSYLFRFPSVSCPKMMKCLNLALSETLAVCFILL